MVFSSFCCWGHLFTLIQPFCTAAETVSAPPVFPPSIPLIPITILVFLHDFFYKTLLNFVPPQYLTLHLNKTPWAALLGSKLRFLTFKEEAHVVWAKVSTWECKFQVYHLEWGVLETKADNECNIPLCPCPVESLPVWDGLGVVEQWRNNSQPLGMSAWGFIFLGQTRVDLAVCL